MSAIYKREMLSFFTSPTGYVFSAIFFAISGVTFALDTVYAGTTDTNNYFSTMLLFFIILIPLLTMKLLSEERKSKTEQILMTSPVSLAGIISAKFFAAYTVFAGTLIVSSVINMLSLNALAKKAGVCNFKDESSDGVRKRSRNTAYRSGVYCDRAFHLVAYRKSDSRRGSVDRRVYTHNGVRLSCVGYKQYGAAYRCKMVLGRRQIQRVHKRTF